MKKIIRPWSSLTVLACTVLLVTSCNIYSPLASEKSDEDHIEKALQCLHENNYDCAIEHYGKLNDTYTKQQKLCAVYLSKGGFTLHSLTDVVQDKDGGVSMLGKFAQTLVPWTQARQDAIDAAKENCDQFYETANANRISVLLKTLGSLTRCASLIAKTDKILGSQDSDEVCETAGNNNGTIGPEDIQEDGSGHIATQKAMCKTDVLLCRDAISQIPSEKLGDSELPSLKDAYDLIPDDLKDSAAGATLVRTALFEAVGG